MEIFRFKLIIILLSILIISCSDDSKPEQEMTVPADTLSENTQKAGQIKDTNSYIKIDIPVDDIIPAVFTQEDLDLIIETGNAPFVINLRKALNDFYKGNESSPYFEKSAVTAVGDNLNSFNKSYYKSKFYILVVNQDYPVGGVFMDILFRDKPDKVFTVWMFETENEYKLRMFEQNLDYSDSDIKGTLKLFENVFKLDNTAF